MAIIFGYWSDGVITGTDSNDLIFGSCRDDVIDAGGGNDIIISFWGDDEIDAGDGNDLVFAGSGDDDVNGGLGCDVVFGGRGDDILRGDGVTGVAAGVNLIVNGSFEDTTGLDPESFGFDNSDSPDPNLPVGWMTESGPYTELVNGDLDRFPDAPDGVLFLDLETGPATDDGSSNVTISQNVQGVVDGAAYKLTFSAASWFDEDSIANNVLEVYFGGVLVRTVVASEELTTLNEFVEFEVELTGGMGDGSNKLTFKEAGIGGNDRAVGTALDDVSFVAVEGSSEEGGDDVLIGGSGNDTMYGDGGDDYLRGGNGNDTNTGGSGNDIFAFDAWDGTDTITDFELGADKILLKGSGSLSVDYVAADNDTVITFGYTTIIVEDVDLESVADPADYLLA